MYGGLHLRLAVLLAAALFSVGSVAGQCLNVLVLDPLAAPLTAATVTVGDQQQSTDDSGVAIFCDLGAGPHWIMVAAPGFQLHEESVQQSEGRITVTLQLRLLTEELVVVGTRAEGRDTLESMVPVEVVVGEGLRRSGQLETGRALQMLAPSFNFSSSTISDGTDALRPATLRGLGPDQTLVLVNGKRRHNSALLHVNTSVGRGTAGTDMNAVPIGAIKRIEVLRDGAAAQYGSDAIAGVINIVLKDRPGFSMDTSWGQTYAGDGDIFTHSMHQGFAFGDDGFLNLTFDTRHRDRTNRAGLSAQPQYPLISCDPVQPYAIVNGAGSPGNCFDPREYDFRRKNFRIGDADSEQYGVYYNTGIPVGETASFYSFGGFSVRDNNSAGFYRRANQNRTVLQFYPDGFLPEINTDVNDLSLAAGVRWKMNSGWNYDLSLNHGRNKFNFFISNSNNASYGTASPREADAGGPEFDQTTLNFDVSRLFEYSSRTMNLAFGGEFRRDGYGIRPGEPVSYLNCKDDPNADPSACVAGVPAGIQVFPGFQAAVAESRTNTATYADLEWTFNNQVSFGTAGRFERYSDFGSTLNGKLSTRYDFAPEFALRGSVNTGFRAPSLHQLYFTNVSTQFVLGPGGDLVPVEVGTLRNDSSAAQALGIPQLKEETSTNFSGGIVARMTDTASLTLDAFRVTVDDRIVISGRFNESTLRSSAPDVADALLAGGTNSAQFFTNAAQTKTSGVEFSFNSVHFWSNGSLLDLRISGMYADTKLEGRHQCSHVAGRIGGHHLREPGPFHPHGVAAEHPLAGDRGLYDRAFPRRRRATLFWKLLGPGGRKRPTAVWRQVADGHGREYPDVGEDRVDAGRPQPVQRGARREHSRPVAERSTGGFQRPSDRRLAGHLRFLASVCPVRFQWRLLVRSLQLSVVRQDKITNRRLQLVVKVPSFASFAVGRKLILPRIFWTGHFIGY